VCVLLYSLIPLLIQIVLWKNSEGFMGNVINGNHFNSLLVNLGLSNGSQYISLFITLWVIYVVMHI
jgi:hypothetical protein